jgi:hypothetical protein
MHTPLELKELFGGTSANSFALVQAALMNVAGQWFLRKAINQLRNARDERELQEIRQRIDDELKALSGNR